MSALQEDSWCFVVLFQSFWSFLLLQNCSLCAGSGYCIVYTRINTSEYVHGVLRSEIYISEFNRRESPKATHRLPQR